MDTFAPDLTDFPDSTPAELRVPTSVHDLPVITERFRRMESLETRYAEERFAKGKVVFVAVGKRRFVATNMLEFLGLQRAARGW